MTSNVFHVFFCHLCIFSEASGQIFYLFIDLFSYQVKRVRHTFWLSVLYEAWSFQIFSVCGFSFSSLQSCFTEDLSSSLAGVCCQLLTTWASPLATHNIADCCTEANESERWTKQVFFITQSSKLHLIVFAIFYSL